MAERYGYHPQQQQKPQQQQQQQQQKTQQQQQPLAHKVVKTVGAATAGGLMMLLSGITLVGTVIGLTVVTPLLVIFSPVLVPAAITMFLITLGFLSSGGFGVAALSVAAWVYRYVTGKHPVGADKIDQAKMTLATKARDVKDTVGQKAEQLQSS